VLCYSSIRRIKKHKKVRKTTQELGRGREQEERRSAPCNKYWSACSTNLPVSVYINAAVHLKGVLLHLLCPNGCRTRPVPLVLWAKLATASRKREGGLACGGHNHKLCWGS
jgi:hypothetical protein